MAVKTTTTAPKPAPAPAKKRNGVPTLLVILVLAAAAIVLVTNVASKQVGAERTTSDGITRIIGDAAETGSVAIPIALQEGGDVEHEASHIFEALDGVPGLAKASLSFASLTLTVTYDKDYVDEAGIVSAMQQSGYATP